MKAKKETKKVTPKSLGFIMGSVIGAALSLAITFALMPKTPAALTPPTDGGCYVNTEMYSVSAKVFFTTDEDEVHYKYVDLENDSAESKNRGVRSFNTRYAPDKNCDLYNIRENIFKARIELKKIQEAKGKKK